MFIMIKVMIKVMIMTLIMINNTSVLALRRGLRRVFSQQKQILNKSECAFITKCVHFCVFQKKLGCLS